MPKWILEEMKKYAEEEGEEMPKWMVETMKKYAEEEGEEIPKWIVEEMKKLERSEKRFAAMTKEEHEAFSRSIGDDARFWEDFTDYYS